MKKIIRIITIGFSVFFFVSCCSSKLSSDVMMRKHLAVIKYLENHQVTNDFLREQKIPIDKNAKIGLAVSPEVNYIDLVSFASFIKKHSLYNLDILGYKPRPNDNVFDSLLVLDKKLRFKTYYNYKLENLSTDKKSKAIIFFSKVFNNILGVRLIYDRNFEKELLPISYENPSLELLFIFDKNDKITHVLYEEFWP